MRYRLILFLTALLLTACDESPFDTHPYDVDFEGPIGINTTNIAFIESACSGKDTIRVAFISDTHGWYSDTKDEIAALNHRNDIDFVVHCGDLTDTGTTKEFVWIRDILGGLSVPYVAMIGNHDFLGTGDQAYNVMYGPMDFSFIVARIKFLCLNTNATEYDYMAAVPNFDYMEQEKSRDSARFDRTVVVMHAAPYTDQFNNNVCKAFRVYLEFLPGLLCCVHGHGHDNKTTEPYNDGLKFYSVASAEHRNYRVFTFTPDGYEEELVYF